MLSGPSNERAGKMVCVVHMWSPREPWRHSPSPSDSYSFGTTKIRYLGRQREARIQNVEHHLHVDDVHWSDQYNHNQ